MFWVYILQNPTGRFYIGQTDDLSIRLANHNRTDKISGKYTRKNGPWTLVWSEPHPTRSGAMERERQIKSMKSASWIRQHLLHGSVPTDLSQVVAAAAPNPFGRLTSS
jgi:putative endonuclease